VTHNPCVGYSRFTFLVTVQQDATGWIWFMNQFQINNESGW